MDLGGAREFTFLLRDPAATVVGLPKLPNKANNFLLVIPPLLVFKFKDLADPTKGHNQRTQNLGMDEGWQVSDEGTLKGINLALPVEVMPGGRRERDFSSERFHCLVIKSVVSVFFLLLGLPSYVTGSVIVMKLQEIGYMVVGFFSPYLSTGAVENTEDVEFGASALKELRTWLWRREQPIQEKQRIKASILMFLSEYKNPLEGYGSRLRGPPQGS